MNYQNSVRYTRSFSRLCLGALIVAASLADHGTVLAQERATRSQDGSRFGMSSKPRSAEITALSEFSGKLGFLPDETFEDQIQIHRAHTVMLARQKIITREEAAAILGGLGKINERAERDTRLRAYLVYENALIKEVGAPAGKMHIGRSRNDLANTYNRMYYRSRINEIIREINNFRTILTKHADENRDTIMMVYTHAKQAQPVTYGHYLMAHNEALGKHVQRYEDLYKRVNQNPLGSAASAGTGWPLDRDFTTRMLGFDALVINTIEGVAGWDHIAEFATVNSILLSGLSRLAGEMTYWQTDEFNAIDLDGSYTGNSSIMPQKKNPNILEATRAMGAKALADQVGVIASLNAVPYQHTATRHLLPRESLDGVVATIRAMAGAVDTLTPNKQRMKENVDNSYAMMTELTDTIVRESGISFREAHDVVAHLVVENIEQGKGPRDINAEAVGRVARSVLGRDLAIERRKVAEALDAESNIARFNLPGGPAPSAVSDHIRLVKLDIDHSTARLAERENALASAQKALDAEVESLVRNAGKP